MFLFASSSFAEVPVNPHFTPMSLLPQPFASTSSLKVAGIYWLPDYLGKNISRGSEDIGGGDIVKDNSDCMKHYNLYETCPSPKLSTGVVHPIAGMTCQKGCICPSEYIYSSSNCAGEYQVSGTACDGKYNACSPKPCTSGGYYAEQQTDRICSAVTYGGRTCYSCYQPQCSAGGYETSTKSGYLCSAVAYYGRTCYSCKNDTCPSGYGKSSCGSAYHQTGTAKTEAGSTCYACAAHSYSCPNGTQASSSGMITPVAVSKTCSCGAKSGSCYKEGHSHSYNCPSGYQTSSCSSSQVQTSTTSKVCSCGATSGTCYKCRAKTCAEQGKKDCNGSCINTSECCGGCPSGKTCKNGTCVSTCIGSSSCSGPTDCGRKGYYASCQDCAGVTHYSCYECDSSSDCPSYSPVCTDGFCRCKSGYYLNGAGYCCPNDVPSGTSDSRCYY